MEDVGVDEFFNDDGGGTEDASRDGGGVLLRLEKGRVLVHRVNHLGKDVARSVVNTERGKHPTHVFSYRGRPLARMLSTGWRDARNKAELSVVRVHDLKHTFGRRLRAAGVSFEDRQDLLGHSSGRITTHYSSAELQNLYESANRVCEKQKSGVVLTLLRNPNGKSLEVGKQASKLVAL